MGLNSFSNVAAEAFRNIDDGHPLAKKKKLVMEDLAQLPTVRFTQEKDEYLYYSENFVDTSSSSQMFNVTDRATLR